MNTEQKKFGFFDDDEGAHSSKRLIAFILIINAIIMSWIYLFYPNINHESKDIIKYFLESGVFIAVGGTFAEKIKDFLNKNKYKGEQQ